LEAFRRQYGKHNPVYDRLAEARIEELKQRLARLEAEEHRRKAEADLRPGRAFRDCPECPGMVVVPAGSFLMGALKREGPGDYHFSGPYGHGANSHPQHLVTIVRPFAVGRFEVTFAEWDACVAAGGCRHMPADAGWGRGRRPVINVSPDDITGQYLPWLSRRTGKTYRLLTEAEWEYAARAGTTTPFWWGKSISTSQANYNGHYNGEYYFRDIKDFYGPKGEYRARTVPVDSFAANPWGLHNVHGNVAEWLQDCWHSYYDGAPSDGSAWATGDCELRVVRGGAWRYGAKDLRTASRDWGTRGGRLDYIGFRVARTLPGS
jgi:formylglycine-generating enzyme required for sulfatase activity